MLIPSLRPRLPTADRLLPYLRRIDASRTYTNWGPLTAELEQKLVRLFGLPDGGAVLTSSGTTALVATLLGTTERPSSSGTNAIIPAFTFVATALAAELAGFRPHLVDVDADTWRLDPCRLPGHKEIANSRVVIPVAPFGRAVPQKPWMEFARRTGIQVLIDGGASFEAIGRDPAQFLGPIPVALSFHATKSFSTAEGGCVLGTDSDVMRRVGEAINFGFQGGRVCQRGSLNGKMSEYHAAIGLAELDCWTEKEAALRRVAGEYGSHFERFDLRDRLIVSPDVAGCYAFFASSGDPQTGRIVEDMITAGIETRFWYGSGLHQHPHFAASPADSLSNTERLARSLVALPVAPDLATEDIERVTTTIARSLRR